MLAATNDGGGHLRTIINRLATWRLGKKSSLATIINEEGKVTQRGPWYDDWSLSIYYCDRMYPYFNTTDTWSTSGAVTMGHEVSHAIDHIDKTLYNLDENGKRIYNRSATEWRAGSFGNYLRSVYRLFYYRDEYGGQVAKYNTNENFINPTNERVTDLKLLGNHTITSNGLHIIKPSYEITNNQMVGVSYTSTTEIIGVNGVVKRTKKYMYSLTWKNSSGEVDFYKTSSSKAYNAKVQELQQANYKFATEREKVPR